MSTFLPFLKSILAGFFVAMPIGAIGVLCIRRTLLGKRSRALSIGSGAASADSLLAAGAVLGLSLITQHLLDHQGLLQMAGGIVLVAFGAHSLTQDEPSLLMTNDNNSQQKSPNAISAFATDFSTGFGLTIVNPATFLAFVGVFAALDFSSLVQSRSYFDFFIVLGVFLGSLLWWMCLIVAATVLRYLLPNKIVNSVNAILGISLIALGMAALVLA